MNITLRLGGGIERRLREVAAEKNLTVDECRERLTEQAVLNEPAPTASADSWERELRAWPGSHSAGPIIAADDRDRIDAGRGE